MASDVVALPTESTPLDQLPARPSEITTEQIVAACDQIFASREHIIRTTALPQALEAARRASAIERYVANRQGKQAARRAARVLETAVGMALGPATQGQRSDLQLSPASESKVPKDDARRFRLMAEHREVWWPALVEHGLSRSEVLRRIERSRESGHQAPQTTCVVDDLFELAASGSRFGCIYADPPWLYTNQGTRASTGNHYAGMTVPQLCALPIGDLAADDAHLHLWTTNGFLFECPKIFDAWGFEFRSSFIWVKPQIGIGNYWRNSHEFLLTAVRGKAKRFRDKTLRSWLECDRSRHSAKPELIRHMIERASPGPYLELFGRSPADGWAVWGNEVDRGLLFHHLGKVGS